MSDISNEDFELELEDLELAQRFKIQAQGVLNLQIYCKYFIY